MSKTEAATAVDAVLDSVADALKAGEQVTLVGLALFLFVQEKHEQVVILVLVSLCK